MDREPTDDMDEILERLRERRREAAESRRRKRRRVLAIGAAVGLVLIAVAGLALLPRGGDDPGTTTAGNPKPPAKGADAPRQAPEAPDRQDRAGWKPSKAPVPILMYHPIEEPVPGNPYPDLFLLPGDFRDQVQWLARSGYEAVTLDEVLDSWFGKGKLPPKPVVLSFDDGYVSQYENALPVMRKRGWPGVLNLKAADSDIYDRQVEEMVASGWEIASHTVTHPDLPSIAESQLEDEMVTSRKILEKEFDTPVTNFCYPAGRYDDRVIEAVRQAGYRSATSTEPGLASPSDRWSLDRIRIELGDGAAELESKMAAAGA